MSLYERSVIILHDSPPFQKMALPVVQVDGISISKNTALVYLDSAVSLPSSLLASGFLPPRTAGGASSLSPHISAIMNRSVPSPVGLRCTPRRGMLCKYMCS